MKRKAKEVGLGLVPPAAVSGPVENKPAPFLGKYERKFTAEGREFTLDFDLAYLAEAELACAREGRYINLLFALNP